MRLFFIAFQFLTIIPLPFTVRTEERDLGRAMALFPLVGLALGSALAGLDYLLSMLLPRGLTDLLLVAVLAILTGALHLDGLADVCDGLAARGGREKFLEVMKDSRVGPVGVVGLVFALLLKYQALLAVPQELKTSALFLFPMIARFSQVQITTGAGRARGDGLGALFVAGVAGPQLGSAALVATLLSFFLLGFRGGLCILVAMVVTWFLKGWFHRRLGGITGDIIGCVSELNEIITLVTIVALAGLPRT